MSTSRTYSLTDLLIACSGPSILETDVFSWGVPVCAISTAIRCIPHPQHWALIDPFSSAYGPEGKAALKDPAIHSITKWRGGKKKDPWEANVTKIAETDWRIKTTIDLAMYWAVERAGVKRILIAGMDLTCDYAWGRRIGLDMAAHTVRLHKRCILYLKKFIERHPQVEVLSVTPSSAINEFLDVA